MSQLAKDEHVECHMGKAGAQKFLRAYHAMPSGEICEVGIGADGHGAPFLLVSIPAITVALSAGEARALINVCRTVKAETAAAQDFAGLAGTMANALARMLTQYSGGAGHA